MSAANSKLLVGDAVTRSIVEDIKLDGFLSKEHLKQIRAACDKALKGQRPSITTERLGVPRTDVAPPPAPSVAPSSPSTPQRGGGGGGRGAKRVKVLGEIYGNMTAAFKGCGLADVPVSDLKKFRGKVNTAGNGTFEWEGTSYDFEVVE